MNKILPDKPSDLLELAVRDCAAVKKRKGYAFSMSTWHMPSTEHGVCYVCMAGAIMACTLKARKQNYSEPDDFDRNTTNKLLAVDAMRTGDLQYAFSLLRVEADRGLMNGLRHTIKDGWSNKLGRATWVTYRRVIEELRKHEL
jgi:hypothetical protein